MKTILDYKRVFRVFFLSYLTGVMMSRSFSHTGIKKYLETHDNMISAHYLQSAAVSFVIDLLYTPDSSGEVTITKGRNARGEPLAKMSRIKPHHGDAKLPDVMRINVTEFKHNIAGYVKKLEEPNGPKRILLHKGRVSGGEGLPVAIVERPEKAPRARSTSPSPRPS